MSLAKFNSRLRQELPRINAAIDTELSCLPLSCQPIATHIIAAGGKRLRPFLTVISAALFGNIDRSIYRLAASMEMLHAATLLHDDILDQAATRRGRPAAHTIFGLNKTILAGDALLAAGNMIVASYNKPELTDAYSQATLNTAAGEILEMDSLRKPDTDHKEYLEIARGKTACLIAQACKLGAIYASANETQLEAIANFGENLGLAFQLVDDALDFAPESQTGKPSGGDLREGKMTPPLILYRESLSCKDRAAFDAEFISGQINEDSLKIHLEAIPAFASDSLKFADAYLSEACQSLENLPKNEENAILAEMAAYVRSRKM